MIEDIGGAMMANTLKSGPFLLGMSLLALATAALYVYSTLEREPATEKEAPHATTSGQDAWCIATASTPCLPQACRTSARTVVVFSAEWCSWCQVLHEETLSDARVIEALRPYAKVSVELDQNKALADAYAVEAVPLIIVLGPDCEERGRMLGFVDADEFLETLRRFESAR